VQLTLTDRLTCPRCGPTFGLILLANRLVERRVHDGVLGCPNCRDSFPVVDGFTDLRAPPREALPAGLAGTVEDADGALPTEADKVIALLGIPRGPGTAVLIGRPARHAWVLAEAIEELQVVAVDPDLKAWPDSPDVSRLACAPGLPFFSRTLRGVVIDGRLGPDMIREAARVVAPMSRVVVVGPQPGVDRALLDEGLSVLAADPETVVAARS
jgi:uncharacterized protein YbaR (Trm112 family)